MVPASSDITASLLAPAAKDTQHHGKCVRSKQLHMVSLTSSDLPASPMLLITPAAYPRHHGKHISSKQPHLQRPFAWCLLLYPHLFTLISLSLTHGRHLPSHIHIDCLAGTPCAMSTSTTSDPGLRPGVIFNKFARLPSRASFRTTPIPSQSTSPQSADRGDTRVPVLTVLRCGICKRKISLSFSIMPAAVIPAGVPTGWRRFNQHNPTIHVTPHCTRSQDNFIPVPLAAVVLALRYGTATLPGCRRGALSQLP
jgi:hypothetical protein